MQAGKLRHRIELKRLSETRDAHGGVVRQFDTDSTLWGSVEPLRGRELMDAQQVESQVTHRIRLRGDAVTLRPSQRLVHRGRVFEIVTVLDVDERRRELEVMCTEVVAA